ncbi:MAG: MFS transporter [Hyphomicrobiaceae bacterium]
MTGYGIRVSVFFAALFLIYGVHIPYLPLWLEWRGLTAAEIGIVTAVPYFARLAVTPTVAFAADRIGDHRRVIVVLAGTALMLTLLLSQSHGFWAILVVSATLAVTTWTIMPLTETVAIVGVRRGLDYGRMRLWGSLTFIAASFIGGAVIDWSGRGAGVWLLVAGAAATLAAAFLLPRRTALPPLAADPTGDGAARGIDAATVLRLARDARFVLFMLAIGTVMASHAALYTFGSIIWQGQGLSPAWIGTLWAIGVFTEIALFAWSAPFVARLGAMGLLIAGALGAVVRWVAMAFDPPLALLVPLQMLHGLTYGAAHLGAIHFIGRAVPEAAGGTAQGFYSTIAAGVMHGLATVLSGLIFQSHGSATYWAMAGLSAIGLVAALDLRRRWSGGVLW